MDWFDVLNTSVHSLNTASSSALGGKMSPSEFMYGRRPRSLLDVKFGVPDAQNSFDHWQLKVFLANQFAQNALTQERSRSKNTREAKNQENTKKRFIHKTGDRVLVLDKTEKTLTMKLTTDGHVNPFEASSAIWRQASIRRPKGNRDEPLVYEVEFAPDNNLNRVKLVKDVHAEHLKPDPTFV